MLTLNMLDKKLRLLPDKDLPGIHHGFQEPELKLKRIGTLVSSLIDNVNCCIKIVTGIGKIFSDCIADITER